MSVSDESTCCHALMLLLGWIMMLASNSLPFTHKHSFLIWECCFHFLFCGGLGTIPSHSVWDLRWAEWQWIDFSPSTSVPPLPCYYCTMLHICISFSYHQHHMIISIWQLLPLHLQLVLHIVAYWVVPPCSPMDTPLWLKMSGIYHLANNCFLVLKTGHYIKICRKCEEYLLHNIN
jgi:hypothetical protein